MVHLIGVHHARRNLLFGISELSCGEFRLIPSDEFLAYLSDFPNRTKIGLETFSDNDFQTVRNHLWSLAPDGRYPLEHQQYWKVMFHVCERFEFPFECLEDKELWYKYNEAAVKVARLNETIHEKVLFMEEGESDFHYSVKLARCNEARNKSQLKVRKIHELKRDRRLLERIAETGVEVVVCGDGHASPWYAERDRIKQEFGIDFESYSTDLMVPLDSHGNYEMQFTQNASVNKQLVVYNEGLLRSLRLLKSGRLTDGKKPDFVGTWRDVMPSEGYFELFLGNNEIFSGNILDCLGDAVFDGEINNKEVRFVKKYTRANQTLTKPVEYRGICVDGGFCGYYHVKGCGGGLFFMKPGEIAKPLELSVGIYRTLADRREELTAIAKQFK